MDADDVQLGARYRDTISGWVGVATGRYEYLNGCVRVELSSSADGKPDGYVFDTQQLEPEPDAAESAGCGPECSECHTFVAPCEQALALAPTAWRPLSERDDGERARVAAMTAAEQMAHRRTALDDAFPESELLNQPEPVHPLVRFWRWLWDPPAQPPVLRVGKPFVGEPTDPEHLAGHLAERLRTGGPRSTPPRTGSR